MDGVRVCGQCFLRRTTPQAFVFWSRDDIQQVMRKAQTYSKKTLFMTYDHNGMGVSHYLDQMWGRGVSHKGAWLPETICIIGQNPTNVSWMNQQLQHIPKRYLRNVSLLMRLSKPGHQNS